MPDCLLINPPVEYYTQAFFGQLPSLSIASISAVLNAAGIATSCVDMEALHAKPADLQSYDLPRLIGFTCSSMQAQGVRECIQALRRSGYAGRIMAGGTHATLKPDEVLAWGADLVVTGECEGNIVELVRSQADGIQEGEQAPIDELPLPDWEHYRPSITSYAGQYEILHPCAGVSMWTRGCPYSCIYCADLIFNHQPKRYRKPQAIAAEMAYLKRRGISRVFVYDDEIIGSRAPIGWMHEVANLLEPLQMTWIAQARCSRKYVTPGVLADARRAGCKMLLWGVESFSPNVLAAVQKHTTPDDIWHSLETSHAAGIANSLFLMVGNYKETEADAQITAQELERAYRAHLVDRQQVFAVQTMEGTELERCAKAEGWYTPPLMRKGFMKQATAGTPWLTAGQIAHYRDAYRQACPVPQP